MGNIFMEFFTTRIRVQLSVIKPDSTDAITVHGVKKDNYLLQIMQQARCNQELEFETTSTSWGESVTSINGLRAESSKREYWALLDGTTGNFLPLGVSSYQPSDGEHIVFELRKW
uniref:Transcobalamin-like C-terminal domain-containing protein n=1 Tax=Ciona savignyi TaxID=51511 RepID=H2YXV5_CIOSA